MTYKLATYLDLAERILELDEVSIQDDNAYVRTSISRAYYSVFCIARNIKGMKYAKDFNLHAAVIDEFLWSTTLEKKTERRIGQFLQGLKRLRVIADYHEEKDLRKKDAETAIAQARVCLNNLQEIYGERYPLLF
jgi:uncharacterized protein (UPF0332 family)